MNRTPAPNRLPLREGPRPATTATNPHCQLDQNAPADIQEALWRRMCALPGIETGRSLVSVPDARATFICVGETVGPACACMAGREFAHLHPVSDGSLHLTLPKPLRGDAIAAGWCEPHPLAGGVVPETVVMVYGPRDAAELDVVTRLVISSHRFARGDR